VPLELTFEVNGLQLAALRWNAEARVPVIALHGWLDNAESFRCIAESMPDIDLVAFDMAGHGWSEHRAAHANYLIWDDLRDILAVADALGWRRFALLGHSRGGIVAALLAAACPERIIAVGLIDGLWAQTCDASQAPAQLAKALKACSSGRETTFSSIEAMVALRLRSGFPISESAARHIVQRNAVEIKSVDPTLSEWRWRSDPRLKLPSLLMLTPEQQTAFLQALLVPVHLVLAESGLVLAYPDYAQRLKALPLIEWSLQAGNHHLHMDAAGRALGEWFNRWFLEHAAKVH
jgi:pimeloyl-ACP methyl ester carboxylesterase